MKWSRGASTEYVRDERGQSPGSGLGSILGGLGPVGKGGGAAGLVIALLLLFLGGRSVLGSDGGFDPSGGLDGTGTAQAAPAGQSLGDQAPDPDADLKDFVTYVFDDVQTFWGQQLGEGTYRPATLVLFTGQTQSGCGLADSGMGPFYCPVDMTARLDLDFFRELQNRFGAPGDFAQAYVIAHERGHHVQNLVGISDKVHDEEQSNPDQANELSVRLELQADCLAGVWGHSVFARGDLDQGDVEEALGAAQAVGDDTLSGHPGSTINQDTWTHGSSAERVKWFTTGYESGDASTCDTFSAKDLG